MSHELTVGGTSIDLTALRQELRPQGAGVIQFEKPGRGVHSYPWDSPWLTDPEFSALHHGMRDHTLVDRQRCYTLYTLAEQTRDVPGAILEVGVWRGGTTALLAQSAPERQVYAADTFSGVVKPSELDPHYKGGEHSDTSREVVEKLLGGLGVSNVTILEGVYPDDTGQEIADQTLSLVHIDVDTHHSARDAFHAAWPNVSQSGVVVFDDYGFISACGGIKTFVDGLRDDPDKLFIPNLNGQAYIIKK